jgi:hypothetical protein
MSKYNDLWERLVQGDVDGFNSEVKAMGLHELIQLIASGGLYDLDPKQVINYIREAQNG